MRTFSRLISVVSLALPASALSASVYLNNVNIDGVTNQRFEKATVRIDDKGNVFIDAAGYQVKAVEGAAAAPATSPRSGTAPAQAAEARLTRRYWLVAQQSVPGMTEYDFDIYVNSKWIRKVKNADDQVVAEISRHLVPGKNTVLINATKLPSTTARRSLSAEHKFSVIIGEGNVGGDQQDKVMIDTPLVRFERTAAEGTNVSQEYSITAR
jgi:hypothetical protein